MLPETDTYGTWPASGEIDILESRGNLGSNYATGGRNAALSTLHWGPTPATDAYFRTGGDHRLQRGDYSQEFHTYGLEWSERYMFLYIDSRLLQVFFIRFPSSSSMWQRGKFSSMIFNDTITYQNPWAAGGPNAPFDQEFYLILNVAVGATNGYFPDGVGSKPWVDGSEMAMSQFWNASSSWLPTWGEGERRGMTVSKVEMWREGACSGT
jgi:beta-glucanase (GH16 family)